MIAKMDTYFPSQRSRTRCSRSQQTMYSAGYCVTVLVVSFLLSVKGDAQVSKTTTPNVGHLIEGIINGPNDNNASTANLTSSDLNTTTSTTLLPSTTPKVEKPYAELPGKGGAEEEKSQGMTIFFILIIIGICILVIHLLIKYKFVYLPESIAIIIVGSIVGGIVKLMSTYNISHWQEEEAFRPTIFFLIMLPPIIFESGYNLHKGNFFQNIGSIMVFAIFGTIISAMVVGGGIYLVGKAQVAYPLTLVESFAFGSLISAVDPVATLAIFHAIEVDPVLYMLVFGESVLNDAVSIVLTTTVLEISSQSATVSGAAAFFSAVGRFCLMFFASALIGAAFGIISAILLKFVDLRKTPSLEFGLMLIFSYAPYGLAEGLKLSGIMAILFCGIVMSHYTHLNLSPVTQITTQQTFRTVAFMAETCVFAYLGLAISSFEHNVQFSFVLWSIGFILLGRALNIFPLAMLVNYFREHKITRKMQFIMWFSGLRGAVAFALSLHLELDNKTRQVMVTSTLIIVLFTVMVLGGSTMPLLKLIDAKSGKRKKRKPREITLSKTKEMDEPMDTDVEDVINVDGRMGGETVDSEHLSEITDIEEEVHILDRTTLRGFMKLDVKYFIPFLTRQLTKQELREGRTQMTNLTNQWYQDVRADPGQSESEDEEMRNLTAETHH